MSSGCDYNPPRPPDARIYDMTDSGVVESVEEMADGEMRVTLAGRDEVVVVSPNAHRLDGGGMEPDELLVLAASPRGAPAYASFPYVSGYSVVEPALDDGSHILFLNGLRLPKSPEFDPGPIDDGAFPAGREGFCLNAAGEVLGYAHACPQVGDG